MDYTQTPTPHSDPATVRLLFRLKAVPHELWPSDSVMLLRVPKLQPARLLCRCPPGKSSSCTGEAMPRWDLAPDGPSQCVRECLAVPPLPLAHTWDGVVCRGLLGLIKHPMLRIQLLRPRIHSCSRVDSLLSTIEYVYEDFRLRPHSTRRVT